MDQVASESQVSDTDEHDISLDTMRLGPWSIEQGVPPLVADRIVREAQVQTANLEEHVQRLRRSLQVAGPSRLDEDRIPEGAAFSFLRDPSERPLDPGSTIPAIMSDSDAPTEDGSPQHPSNPPLTGSAYVAALPRISPEGLEDNEYDRACVLCKEQFTEDPVQLPCTHNFHSECLLPWLSEEESNQNTCPICRRVLFERQSYGGIRPGPDGIIDEHFIPLSVFDDSGPEGYRPGGRLRDDYEEIRELINHNRRLGVISDAMLYERLILDGAMLELPEHIEDSESPRLTIAEDRAMFEELRDRGAFAGPAMDHVFRRVGRLTDKDIYELLRDSGAIWCTNCERWHEGAV